MSTTLFHVIKEITKQGGLLSQWFSSGVVQGYVLDQHDKPVPNVRVLLGDNLSERTMRNGKFLFHSVKGKYVVSVEYDGQLVRDVDIVYVRGGEELELKIILHDELHIRPAEKPKPPAPLSSEPIKQPETTHMIEPASPLPVLTRVSEVSSLPSIAPGNPRVDEDGVILNAQELLVDDVVKKAVLCPLCEEKVFREWPLGWDAHAERACSGLVSTEHEQRKFEFKTKLEYLFRPKFDIFALRTTGTSNDAVAQPMLYEELLHGRARFGWSFQDNSDLRVLQQKGRHTETQEDIWKKAKFFLNVKQGDYLVYINLPTHDLCSIAKVTGSYQFDEGIFCEDFSAHAEHNRDFRHCLPAHFIGTFSRRDEHIPSLLVQKLKLRGRMWRIQEKEAFLSLLRLMQRTV